MNGDRSRKQGSEMKVFKSFLRAKGAITTKQFSPRICWQYYENS